MVAMVFAHQARGPQQQHTGRGYFFRRRHSLMRGIRRRPRRKEIRSGLRVSVGLMGLMGLMGEEVVSLVVLSVAV